MKWIRMMAPLILALLMTLGFTGCGRGNGASRSTFPNISDDSIPDVLEKTVATPGGTYYTSLDRSGDSDYRTYFTMTFRNTTEADLTGLMDHYRSSSTGTDEDGFLLFDWGRVQVTPEKDSIFVEAFIRE